MPQATPGLGGISAAGRHYSAFRKRTKRPPLEFTHSRGHLPGNHSPIVACLRRMARRPDRAVDVFASCCAWEFRKFANEAVRAIWRPRCPSIAHISLGYTTEPLAWFDWTVLMMSPPSNPPGGSSTAILWRFGRRTGRLRDWTPPPNRRAKHSAGQTECGRRRHQRCAVSHCTWLAL